MSRIIALLPLLAFLMLAESGCSSSVNRANGLAQAGRSESAEAPTSAKGVSIFGTINASLDSQPVR